MAEVESSQQDSTKANHIVVLVHGLWGNPIHLGHLHDTVLEHHAPALHVFTPQSNKDNFTYDGIDVGAERVTTEIEAEIKRLTDEGAHLEKISIAGYSLGGLVARYVVGLLYKNGVFDTLEPCNFTTFATPHLGVRTPRLGYGPQTWNFLGSKTLSTSGQQMFLTDSFRETGRPLLAMLADTQSIFVKGLATFKRKSIYANTINDRSVPYYTSAITKTDPFVDLEEIEIHALPDQEYPVVLDPDNPVSPRKEKPSKQLTFRERYILSDKTKEALPFYTFLLGVLPLAVPLFLVNAGYQTYKSAQRVRLHEAGSLIDLKRYRIPLLENTQAVQDRMVERLASESTDRGGEDYLPTPPPEPLTDTSPSSSASNLPQTTTGASAPTMSPLARHHTRENKSSWPTLALTDEQFTMIDNLDTHVKFIKYPVHIQKVRHTHAAIVVRTPKETFVEGKEVSKHWMKNFVL
ncbi:hypothetical protein B0A50_08223 [Salinomyces thailandicus]|uniref:DUF676 domain-containing protein n=1 Tax=Salinomyces thailandicus TaxID=706561 RepID=A0A4U0TK66_9PEZI|nr:hypothetical protein B0A50_08223 [Salinomyces thailandica]